MVKERKERSIQEQFLEQLEEVSSFGRWDLDLIQNKIYWSDGIYKMCGYEPGEFELSFEKAVSIIHPDDRQKTLKTMELAMSGEQAYHLRKRLLTKNGGIIHIVSKALLIRDQYGSPIRLTGIFSDVTDLKNEEEKYQSLFDLSPLPKWVYRISDYQILFANHRAIAHYGYSETEFKQMTALDLRPKEEIQRFLDVNHEYFFDQNLVHFGTFTHLKKNGKKIKMDIHAQKILFDGAECMLVVGQDVTEREEYIEAITKSEARFRGFYESQTNYVIRTDMEGRYSYYNNKFEADYGWIYGTEIMDQECMNSICPHDHEKVAKVVHDCMENPGKIIKVEIDKPSRNGGINTTLWDFVCITDQKGVPLEIQCIGIDITERIQFEKSLQQANERFELVMQAGSDSIWDLDLQSGKLFLSDGFRRNFGIMSKEEHINNEWFNSLLHPDDKDRVLESFQKHLKNKKTAIWEARYRILGQDSKYAFVSDRGVIVRDDTGKAIRVVGAMRDISREILHQESDAIERVIMQEAMQVGTGLEEVMNKLLEGLDQLFPGMQSCVMMVREGRLYKLAAPSLPKSYMEKIEGEEIGQNRGTCGVAAFTGKAVITEAILSDPNWTPYRESAIAFGFKACWSMPICNINGEVVAVFANYFQEEKKPSQEEWQIMERFHQLAGLLFQKFNYVDQLKIINERFEIITNASNEAIFEWDAKKDLYQWGEGFKRIFGHDFTNATFSLEDWVKLMHPYDKELHDPAWKDLMENPKSRLWHKEFQFKKANGTYAYVEQMAQMIRDTQGKPQRLVGVLRDISKERQEQLFHQINSEISAIFTEQTKNEVILKKLVEHLSNWGGFHTGEVWIKSQIDQRLYLQSTYTKTAIGQSFFDLSKNIMHFQFGEGLPGEIWKTKKTTIWDNLEGNKSFIRHKEAKVAGITTFIGIPLLDRDEVVGVMAFGSKLKANELQNYLKIFQQLERSIGTEIKRILQEEELSSFFEYAPDILAIASDRGKFVKVNPAFCKLLGYSAKELTSTPFIEFIHPADLERTQSEYKDTITGDRNSNNFTNRYRTKKGNYKWISWSSSDVFGEDKLVFCYGRDVTELVELQQLLENATKLSKVGGWEVDLIEENHYWSPMTKEIHEVESSFQANMEKALAFYREDYRELVKEKIAITIQDGTSFDFECPIITAKGNEKWVRAIGNAEFVGDTCVKIFGSIQDVTEKKRAEQAIDKLLHERDDILESVGDGFFAVDKNWTINYWNKKAETILGLSKTEALGNNLWDLFPQAVSLDFYQKYHYALEKQISVHFEEYYPQLNKWFEANAYPTENGLAVYFKDITQNIRLKDLAEKSSEMAKVGNWEIQFEKNKWEKMYWSSMTKKILEKEDIVNPNLNIFYSLLSNSMQHAIKKAFDELINKQIPFDLETELQLDSAHQKWIRVIGNIEKHGEEPIRIFGSIQDINDRKLTELELQNRSLYLSTLTNIIGIFLKSDNWEEVMPSVLKLTGEACKADRVYYFKTHQDPASKKELYSQAYEWVRQGISAEIDNPELQNMSFEVYKDFIEPLRQGQMFNEVTAEMPPSYSKTMMEEQDILSCLVIPIFIQKRFYGFMGFDDCSRGRKWSELEIEFLQGIVSNLSTAIFRNETRKQIEEAFKEKETILESIGDAFFALDKDWKVNYWNNKAEEVLGVIRQDILNKNLWEVFSDATKNISFQKYQHAMQTGETVHFEDYYDPIDTWFEISAYPSEKGLSVYFKDVSLRKKAEESIRLSNERFERVTEATQDVIWDWDIPNKQLYWGGRFSKLFGHKIQPMDTNLESWSNFIHPDDKVPVLQSLEKALIDPNVENWQSEYRFLRACGAFAYVIDRGMILRDHKGKPIRMVGAITDITERKANEDALKRLNAKLEEHAQDLAESNKELEQFAYIASHDLQEPLRMVTAFLSQLEKKYSHQLDEKALEYIGFAVDGAKRMRQIILDLLEYSRVNYKATEYSWVNLDEIMEEMRMLYRKKLEDLNAELHFDPMPLVYSHKAPLRQLLQNLVNNALTYHHPDRPPIITIKCEEEKNNYLFSVKDNGIGIAPEHHEKIFLIFNRLHSAKEYAGTGIGLAVCKKIADQLGGKIWVDSAEGRGSTFFVRIPKNR